MTSANVVEYKKKKKNGNIVGTHRQNVMCKINNDKLKEFQPSNDFTIQAFGYDEDEDYWEGNITNLGKWLLKNKPEITNKVFNVGDSVMGRIPIDNNIPLSKKVVGVVTEVLEEKWFKAYLIKLEDGSIEKVHQTQIIPE